MAWDVYIMQSAIEISSACAAELFEANQKEGFYWKHRESVTTPYFWESEGVRKGDKVYLRFPTRRGGLIGDEWSDILGGCHAENFVCAILMKHHAKGKAVFDGAYSDGNRRIYEFDGKGKMMLTEQQRIEEDQSWKTVETKEYSCARYDSNRTVWRKDERIGWVTCENYPHGQKDAKQYKEVAEPGWVIDIKPGGYTPG